MNLREMNKDMLIKIIETLQRPYMTEVAELRKALEKFEIVKCFTCNEYVEDGELLTCECCGFICCSYCEKIKLCVDWSRFNQGIARRICDICIQTYCSHCLQRDEKYKKCASCDTVYCENCSKSEICCYTSDEEN